MIGPSAENEAEAGLSDARVSHQHHLRVHIVNAARRLGGLPFAQQNVEIEFIDVKARAGDSKARERRMKRQTTKAVASAPLDYRDDVPAFGVPDPYRVVPAHRREQGPSPMETQRDNRSAMSFEDATQFAVGHVPKPDGIVETADCKHMPARLKTDTADRTAMSFEETG